MPKQKSESKKTAIIAADDGHFAVMLDGEILRSGFKGRGHAAMWATRRGIYQGSTPPKVKTEIPHNLEDESIKRTRLLARMSHQSPQRFLADARTGMYGPLYQLGKNIFGLKFGLWKAGMAAREIKPAE
jgi:hypothetical protein